MQHPTQQLVMAPVYLTESELRRLIDRSPFSPNTQGYSAETYQTGLKLASALMALTAAPELEVARMLMPGKCDSVDAS